MNTLESLRDAIAQLQAYRFVTPPPGKAIRQWFCPPMEEGMTVISRDAALTVIDALAAVMPQVDDEAISEAAVEAVLVARYGVRYTDICSADLIAAIKQTARLDLAAALPHLSPLPPQCAAGEPFGAGGGYSVEPHGAGFAIYRGRDMHHHGYNLGQLTECGADLAALVEKGLRALYTAPQPAAPAQVAGSAAQPAPSAGETP